MQFLGYIIAIIMLGVGILSIFSDARENGIGFVIFEVIAVIVLAALGL